jgi:predicted small lipoprotein YifL
VASACLKEFLVYRLLRHSGRPLAAVGLLLLLSGCGQTGPLYLPPPQAPATPEQAQTPAPEAP